MRVAVMQPYFFPYIGYFSLIKNVDRFILLDEVQYIKGGWINRNRILNQTDGWLYIQVPLKSHSHSAKIREVEIDTANTKWKRRLLDQLGTYKKIAPFYSYVRKLVEDVISCAKTDSLVHLNRDTIQSVMSYLGLESNIDILSEMDLNYVRPDAADEWSRNICMAIGNVKEYWNPPGGKTFFDREKYIAEKIELRFHEVVINEYDQKNEAFIPGLSIIDVLMFNSPERVREMLDQYSLS